MKALYRYGCKPWWAGVSLAAALGLGMGSLANAADYPTDPATPVTPPATGAQDPASPTAPAEIVKPGSSSPSEALKPIEPSKAETADSAFQKLDTGSKGYVTKDDVRGLQGFDKAFQAADPRRTGKLSAAQFRKAWAAYTGRPEKNRQQEPRQ